MSLQRTPTKCSSNPDLTTENMQRYPSRKRKQPEDSACEQIEKLSERLFEKINSWKADIDRGISSINSKIDTVIRCELDTLSTRTLDMQEELNKLRKNYDKLESTISNLQVRQTEVVKDILDLKNSMEFQSSSHSDLQKRICDLESTNKILLTTDNKVQNLNTQVDQLKGELNIYHQRERIHNLEIIGVPEAKNECLIDLTIKIAHHAGVVITRDCIEHGNRIQPRQIIQGRPRVIVIKLKSRLHKDNIISGLRKCHGIKTKDVGIPGEDRRIYVNEHLTSNNKLLLKKVKDIAKTKLFKYVWVKNCQIFVRRNETSPAILIKNDCDISKIR
ncbi:uncharacterized protein LOC131855617 [Achroia grisella]|uniref:uncharacterized protein LOC131855617 n=1 Tax=Achroia grisella TaxID=688607 RepID=UPI0027D25580|nr:uncharacterized protein LOC131855617 [Achroia grisella]